MMRSFYYAGAGVPRFGGGDGARDLVSGCCWVHLLLVVGSWYECTSSRFDCVVIIHFLFLFFDYLFFSFRIRSIITYQMTTSIYLK